MKEVDNEKDLSDMLNHKKRMFALFYASWCPFCRGFLPVFEERDGTVAEFLRVRIDDDANTLWQIYDVKVVPTVILFEGTTVKDRLDGIIGEGLSRNQLKSFLRSNAN